MACTIAMMKMGVKVIFSPSRCSKAFFTFSRHITKLVTSASTKLVTCGLVRLLMTMWSEINLRMRSISMISSPSPATTFGAWGSALAAGAGAGEAVGAGAAEGAAGRSIVALAP